MRNSPSCRCCGVTCEVAVTEDLTEECDGTWSEISGGARYETSSADAVRYTTLDSAAHPWRVTALVSFDLSSGDDMEVRIIGGMLDCDNYLFAEFKFIWDGIESKWLRQFILGEVVAGVETTLASHPKDLVANVTDDEHEFFMTLCWDGDQLTGIVPTFVDDEGILDTEDILSVNGITPLGNMAGVGTSSLGGGTAGFQDFAFTLSDVEDCGECEESCCEGISPEELLLEISGGTSTYHTWIGGGIGDLGDIRIQASELNGTYTIPYGNQITISIGGSPVIVEQHGGDGHCRWSDVVVMDAERHNGTTWVACTVNVIINIRRTLGSVLVALNFVTGSGGSDCHTGAGGNSNFLNVPAALRFDDASPIPCEEWTDWQDTTLNAGVSNMSFEAELTVRYMEA